MAIVPFDLSVCISIDSECAIKKRRQRENSCFGHSSGLKFALIKFDLLLSNTRNLYNESLNMSKVILREHRTKGTENDREVSRMYIKSDR